MASGTLRSRESCQGDYFGRLCTILRTGFHYAFSLGNRCWMSRSMQLNKRRGALGPFDYMSSTMPMVSHILRDKFRPFLDKNNLRRQPGGWDHCVYSSFVYISSACVASRRSISARRLEGGDQSWSRPVSCLLFCVNVSRCRTRGARIALSIRS